VGDLELSLARLLRVANEGPPPFEDPSSSADSCDAESDADDEDDDASSSFSLLGWEEKDSPFSFIVEAFADAAIPIVDPLLLFDRFAVTSCLC
jgi:hypothetical protein